jgi:hypothetical protein
VQRVRRAFQGHRQETHVPQLPVGRCGRGMIQLLPDEFLQISKGSSFLIIAKANVQFALCIETSSEEFCLTIEPDDLIAVSAPEGGEPEAAAMLIELVRRYHTPLIVLPGNHPGSRRLRYVVSAGPVIVTNCSILRGTHPEQHLICASESLSGVTLQGIKGGVRITNLPPGTGIAHFRSRTSIEFVQN